MATRAKRQSAASTALFVGAAMFLVEAILGGVAGAQTSKTFIDYLQPTPITCSPLSSATWGVVSERAAAASAAPLLEPWRARLHQLHRLLARTSAPLVRPPVGSHPWSD
jgi:hypothetical protein